MISGLAIYDTIQHIKSEVVTGAKTNILNDIGSCLNVRTRMSDLCVYSQPGLSCVNGFLPFMLWLAREAFCTSEFPCHDPSAYGRSAGAS